MLSRGFVWLRRNLIPDSVTRVRRWKQKIQESEGQRRAAGQRSIGFRRNGIGEGFPGPRTGPHSNGLMDFVKRTQNDSRQ